MRGGGPAGLRRAETGSTDTERAQCRVGRTGGGCSNLDSNGRRASASGILETRPGKRAINDGMVAPSSVPPAQREDGRAVLAVRGRRWVGRAIGSLRPSARLGGSRGGRVRITPRGGTGRRGRWRAWARVLVVDAHLPRLHGRIVGPRGARVFWLVMAGGGRRGGAGLPVRRCGGHCGILLAVMAAAASRRLDE